MRVKICGLTHWEDALAAIDAGADLLGFVFYSRSPRFIAPAEAAKLSARIRAHCAGAPTPLLVGLFVNESAAQVEDVLTRCELDLAQLHGNETPDALLQMRGRAFKALRPRSTEEAGQGASQFAALGPAADSAPQLLVDAYHPDLWGGTGQMGDWSVAARLARQQRILLAGGLRPENVAAAVEQVQPWGVDVSSGVEAVPGRKDRQKVYDFIVEAKRCEQPAKIEKGDA